MSLEEKLISFQLSYACKQFLVIYVCISVKTSLFSVGSFLIFVQKLIRRSVAIRMSWRAFAIKFSFQGEHVLRNYK